MNENNNVFDHLIIVKRSGQRVPFNGAKIAIAIKLAFDDVYENTDEKSVNKVYNAVLNYIRSGYENRKTINVEVIQDIIENTLKELKFDEVYQSFNQYRLRRTASREAFSVKEQHKFVKAIEKIGLTVKSCKDNKPLDLIFNFGKTISREFSEAYLLETKYVRAHEEGRIFIGDLDAYALATTYSSHLNLEKIIADNLFCFTQKIIDILLHFKEEQYGEHTICDIDHLYSVPIVNEFRCIFTGYFKNILKLEGIYDYFDWNNFKKYIDNISTIEDLQLPPAELVLNQRIEHIFKNVYSISLEELKCRLEQSIYYLLLAIDKFHFKISKNIVNISFGYCQKPESKLWVEKYLEEWEKEKFKNICTIFKYTNQVDEKITERLLSVLLKNRPITFLYLSNNSYSQQLETFSDGTIIYDNINSDIKTCQGRINLSQTMINLARLGYKYSIHNMEDFYRELTELLELTKNQLIQRYENQANKYKDSFEYMFNDDILFDEKKLEKNQKVRKVLRNGTLNICFVGIGECAQALLDKEVLEENDFKLINEILQFMKKKIKDFTLENKLNFILSEGCNNIICQNLLAIDKALYGEISILKKNQYGVLNDYLNSFSSEKIFALSNQLMKACDFNLTIYLPKNSSQKKIMELIKKGQESNIKLLKIQVGKNDN